MILLFSKQNWHLLSTRSISCQFRQAILNIYYRSDLLFIAMNKTHDMYHSTLCLPIFLSKTESKGALAVPEASHQVRMITTVPVLKRGAPIIQKIFV